MKNLFLTLVLIAAAGYSQKPSSKISKTAVTTVSMPADKLLKKEDFTASNGRMLVNAIPCKVKNENTITTVLVSVVCQQSAFNQLGVDRINEMIRIANEKALKTLSFDHQYKPTEIKMAYFPDSHDWSLTNSFKVRDSKGMEKERLVSVDFDAHGKFSVMKNIL